ncbi:MAG: DUF4386 domain-containing protein [Calditrichaceae bacterium]
MSSSEKISKMAGTGYLIIFITGIFSNFFVLESLILTRDPAATMQNIISHDMLFRAGIFSFVLMVVFDVFLAWALYILLRPVNSNLSLLAGWLRLANSVIFGVALYHLFGILRLLSGAEYLTVFDTAQLGAMVILSYVTFNDIWLIGLVFFGLHLFALGYLIIKSGYIPKFIGFFLVIAAVGYLTDSFANFMLPNYGDYKDILLMIVIVPGVIGELSLTFWLLLKGVKDQSLDMVFEESKIA